MYKKYVAYLLLGLVFSHNAHGGIKISLSKTGTSFACSIGAASALVAASYILTQHYKTIAVQDQSTVSSCRRRPPSEFWWSIMLGSSCIAALFAFTD